ncbi:MAG: cupin [Acidiferrobacteraceae bacterium]|nr:cupin [Acidiferrobacteraceae bacterium]MDP6433820.1 cupin domain-containing protein [Arenicellales bacterium]MDP6672856.1 cupin domain-containing protein [Arenicellales bacterium]MDP6724826.1 cupin domain-containing protein [Arenicellales bacterium]MDP7521665.1 cupin domain-containing protein [Arenicellales bacterium]
MFNKRSDQGFRSLLPGIEMKTLMSQFHLKRESVLPKHNHPYEQTRYLIEGRLVLTIGDASEEMAAGDSWSIPEKAEHGATVLEDAVVIEVFSPVREDFLPGVTERNPMGG